MFQSLLWSTNQTYHPSIHLSAVAEKQPFPNASSDRQNAIGAVVFFRALSVNVNISVNLSRMTHLWWGNWGRKWVGVAF